MWVGRGGDKMEKDLRLPPLMETPNQNWLLNNHQEKKTGIHQKNTYIFCNQRQRRRQNKRVGVIYLQHDQISGLAGGRCTKWKFIILQSCSNRIERTEALVRLKTWGSGIRSRAFSFKGHGGLILGMPQGWGKQWLHSCRAHTGLSQRDPGKKQWLHRCLTRPTCRSQKVS